MNRLLTLSLVFSALLAVGCESPPHVVIENKTDAPLYIQLAMPRGRQYFFRYDRKDYEIILRPRARWDSWKGSAEVADPFFNFGGPYLMFRIRDLTKHEPWRSYVCEPGAYARIIVSEQCDVQVLDGNTGKPIEVEENDMEWLETKSAG